MVLSTQRSGSTLLCRDIASLEKLGTPDEHFLELLSERTVDENSFSRLIAKGNPNGTDYYAINLMYNYLHTFGAWVMTGNINSKRGSIEDRRRAALQFFVDRFDHVVFVAVERKNLFDQALSRYRSQKTNVFHVTNTGKIISGFSKERCREADVIREFDFECFWNICSELVNERRNFSTLIENCGLHFIRLDYATIVDNFPDYLNEIIDSAGIGPLSITRSERALKKIVSKDFYDAARHAFLKRLGLT